MVIVGGVSVARQAGPSTWTSLAINLVVFFVFLGSLVYASVIFHRSRRSRQRSGAYQPAARDPESHDNNPLGQQTQYQPAPYLPQLDGDSPNHKRYGDGAFYSPESVGVQQKGQQQGQQHRIYEAPGNTRDTTHHPSPYLSNHIVQGHPDSQERVFEMSAREHSDLHPSSKGNSKNHETLNSEDLPPYSGESRDSVPRPSGGGQQNTKDTEERHKYRPERVGDKASMKIS
ncbi:MAG: hypothetical protein M1837_000003 [Sclerophora amabilis]|nr:MAG: hypothetical protein M1837_000003 [Sclerophora amabilis]